MHSSSEACRLILFMKVVTDFSNTKLEPVYRYIIHIHSPCILNDHDSSHTNRSRGESGAIHSSLSRDITVKICCLKIIRVRDNFSYNRRLLRGCAIKGDRPWSYIIDMLRKLAIQLSTTWRRCYCKNVTLSSKELNSNKLKSNVKSEVETFERLGVKPYLVKALRNMGILYPTEVQRLSIPRTLAGKHCSIQSETGSGKSLTFLIPALQDDRHKLRTVIVAPTRELGAQLHHMAKSMCPEESGRRIVSLFSGIDNPITVGLFISFV